VQQHFCVLVLRSICLVLVLRAACVGLSDIEGCDRVLLFEKNSKANRCHCLYRPFSSALSHHAPQRNFCVSRLAAVFEPMDRIVFAGDSVTDMGSAQPVGEGLFDNVGQSYVRIIENMPPANTILSIGSNIIFCSLLRLQSAPL